MPPILRATPFTPDMQPSVQSLDCGDSESGKEMAAWIKGPKAIESLNRGNSIWLFHNETGALVGFGSLGKTDWPFPTPQSPREEMGIIPALGVDAQFFGCPCDVPKEYRYAGLILMFLIEQAMIAGRRRLVLYVKKGNTRAINRYLYHGFLLLQDSYKGNRKMYLDLRTDDPSSP